MIGSLEALFSLDGKLALVTGGGSGIGEGIARAMAEHGARVIVADVNESAAERVAASIGGDTAHYELDVTDRFSCDALARTGDRAAARAM